MDSLLCLLLLLAGIPSGVQKIGDGYSESASSPADTPFLKVSFQVEDRALPPHAEGLYGIARADYKRINSVTRWTSIVTRETARALEGGEAEFYFTGTKLEKIIVRDYGEMYQQLTEYYLHKGQLSFVVQERAAYKVPFYLDSTAAATAGETEFFDIKQSEVVEMRYYFENGGLANLVSPQDCGAPWAASFIRDEEKRLKGELKALQLLLKSPK